MNAQEIIAKADRGEGLTVEEIRVYRQEVKPVKHTYGKYGTLRAAVFGRKGVSTGRLPIFPNICTASTVRRTSCMKPCMRNFPKMNGISGRATLWRTTAGRRRYRGS